MVLLLAEPTRSLPSDVVKADSENQATKTCGTTAQHTDTAETHERNGGGSEVHVLISLQVPQTVGVPVLAGGHIGPRHGDLNLHVKCGL